MSSNPLLDEIARLSRERDALERQLRRLRTGIDEAIALTRERPELEAARHRAA